MRGRGSESEVVRGRGEFTLHSYQAVDDDREC